MGQRHRDDQSTCPDSGYRWWLSWRPYWCCHWLPSVRASLRTLEAMLKESVTIIVWMRLPPMNPIPVTSSVRYKLPRISWLPVETNAASENNNGCVQIDVQLLI